MKELAVWLASHANPRHECSSLVNPKPAVRPEGVAFFADRSQPLSVNADQEPVRSLENRERSANECAQFAR